MDEIHIIPTNQTPGYTFDPSGIIKITGRGLYSDKPELSGQITDWINSYLENPPRTTFVTVAFEYLNSMTTIILVSILKQLSLITKQSKTIVVKWYYEDDDEDILERGKYISSYLDIPIEFILTDNVNRFR
jgi:SiaC family regulatory phosphoprotein